MTDSIIHLVWTGPIVPKARPRLTMSEGGRAYMPKNYKACQRAMIATFTKQWEGLGRTAPIEYQVRPYVLAWGKHYRGGDMVDNIPGAIYDALVKAEVIRGDNGMKAPGSFHDLVWSEAPPVCDILLAPWLPMSQTGRQFKEIQEWLKVR